jgi:hypothetical protein
LQSVRALAEASCDGVADVMPSLTNASELYATCEAGLVRLSYDPPANRLTATGLITDAGANDGMAVDPTGAWAYVAAGDGGLRALGLGAGAPQGSAPVAGWAGDAAAAWGFVLVAADPGLLAFHTVNGTESSDPVPAWTCGLRAGTGWNLALNQARCLALVADKEGGLQVVRVCDADQQSAAVKPEVIAHFGKGTMQSCSEIAS